MPTILKTKNSVTTTVVPTSLAQGELAVNITDKKLWVGNAATTPVQLLGAGVTGDVVGPASATDNAISRFDGTTGKLIQNSLVTVSDTGAISAPVDASINGLTVGKGGGGISSNTAIGGSALAANTSGTTNTAVGFQAGQSNTSGTNNTFVGRNTGNANTTGSGNSFIGDFSGALVTTGSFNTALGNDTFRTSTTASNNTAIGWRVLYESTGSNNTGVGTEALRLNTTASNNTAVGYQAAHSNTIGSNNDAFGRQALYTNTSGDLNAAFGQNALFSNTTGTNNAAFGINSGYANTTGSFNVFFGKDALRSNTTASNNTAVGYQAGYSMTVGSAGSGGNLFMGYQAGYTTSTGRFNTFVGYQAGYNSSSSNGNNAFFGNNAGAQITTGFGNTIIGRYDGNQDSLDIRTSSNQIVLSDGDGNARQWIDSNGATRLNYVSWNGAFVTANRVVSVASNATITITGSSAGAVLICVYDSSSGNGGVFFGSYSTVITKIAGDGSATDSGSGIAVYKTAGTHTITFRNRTGSTLGFAIGVYSAFAL